MQLVENRMLYDRNIFIAVFPTEEGTSVTLMGGDKAHVGAVTVVDPEGNMTTHTFPGHRDDVITERWAQKIYEKTRQQVVVSAGIHYDNATVEMIAGIQEFFDRELVHVMVCLFST